MLRLIWVFMMANNESAFSIRTEQIFVLNLPKCNRDQFHQIIQKREGFILNVSSSLEWHWYIFMPKWDSFLQSVSWSDGGVLYSMVRPLAHRVNLCLSLIVPLVFHEPIQQLSSLFISALTPIGESTPWRFLTSSSSLDLRTSTE